MDNENILDVLRSGGITVVDEESVQINEDIKKSVEFMETSSEDQQDLREMAVRRGLFPPNYKNAKFDAEHVKRNIVDLIKRSGHKFKMARFNEYIEATTSIINSIMANKLPDQSFVIGAPNGFGKQSFVVECLTASLRNGWLTVPYISLIELGELRAQNEKVIARGLMGLETRIAHQKFNYNTGEFYDGPETYEGYYYAMGDESIDIKRPAIITGRYSYSEYLNAPILFCFFSGIESKVVESQTLYSLLNIRGSKGFPTVALISTSLDMYTRDPVVGRYVWNEILNYNKDVHDTCRVVHISTNKVYSV